MYEKFDTGTDSDQALLFRTSLRSHEKKKSKAGTAGSYPSGCCTVEAGG